MVADILLLATVAFDIHVATESGEVGEVPGERLGGVVCVHPELGVVVVGVLPVALAQPAHAAEVADEHSHVGARGVGAVP